MKMALTGEMIRVVDVIAKFDMINAYISPPYSLVPSSKVTVKHLCVKAI